MAVLPAHTCQNLRVAMWVRTGLLQTLALTQQPAQWRGGNRAIQKISVTRAIQSDAFFKVLRSLF